MRFLSLFVVFIFISISSTAQVSPVSWTLELKPTPQADIFEVHAIAAIDNTWHIYSKDTGPDGPIGTEFTVTPSAEYEVIGDYVESREPKVKFSELFEVDVASFDKEVSLVQKIKLKNPTAKVEAVVLFMCCSGEQCLPPKEVNLSANM